MSDGLKIGLTARQESPGEWIAENKDMGIEARAPTIEEAFAEATPQIEEWVKSTFDAKRQIVAEMDGIKASASFTIKAIRDRSLSEFEGKPEETPKAGEEEGEKKKSRKKKGDDQ